MNEYEKEIMQFVEENDVKFIRLAFVDLFGTQKNISIMPCELEKAFCKGIPFDASKFQGFFHSKAYLKPIAQTCSLLPWRPDTKRVMRFFCHIVDENGKHADYDSRWILQQVLQDAKEMDMEFVIGSECEFYLLKNDEWGNPTHEAIDQASYFDIAPLDKAENIRRDICLTLEKMGIQPESSHHEEGHGQNEIVFAETEPLSAADNIITYKNVVATMAYLNGCSASFYPLPIPDQPSSGLNFRIKLIKNGRNLMSYDPQAAHDFLENIKGHLPEISSLINRSSDCYQRLQKIDPKNYIKMEDDQIIVHIASPLCNPYLGLAALLAGGFDSKPNGLFPLTLQEADKLLERWMLKREIFSDRLIQAYLK